GRAGIFVLLWLNKSRVPVGHHATWSREQLSYRVQLLMQIREAFDPLCLLNCDEVIRMQKPGVREVAEW
ncbi:glycolate oxidase, partial [Verticillium dahliae]